MEPTLIRITRAGFIVNPELFPGAEIKTLSNISQRIICVSILLRSVFAA
jgi:hypothetical protein